MSQILREVTSTDFEGYWQQAESFAAESYIIVARQRAVFMRGAALCLAEILSNGQPTGRMIEGLINAENGDPDRVCVSFRIVHHCVANNCNKKHCRLRDIAKSLVAG